MNYKRYQIMFYKRPKGLATRLSKLFLTYIHINELRFVSYEDVLGSTINSMGSLNVIYAMDFISAMVSGYRGH
ncbi:hypothetical protein HanIR_Chr17g0894871 [Helianthus annuus]|nr:hypothetical protein HanIR_Chr17g0894871 [Helianthus annuus]